MRRGIAVLSIALVLLGLELTVRIPSTTVGRLRAGVVAVVQGVEGQVGSTRFLVGLLLLTAGLILALLVVWSRAAQGEVDAIGVTCPHCGNRTRRVKRKEWHRLLAVLLGERLSRRRCETCGWTGLTLKR